MGKRKVVHLWWAKSYGFESYRVVSSIKGVSLYVTKYVTKSDLPFWAGGRGFKELVDKGGNVGGGEGSHVASSSG